jgi:hypothetical protein
MRIKLTACGTLTHGKKRRRSHAAAYPRRYADKGHIMKRTLLIAFLFVWNSLAVAAVPVAPSSPEITAAAREVLLSAFSSLTVLSKAKLPADTVSIGPRLWASTVEARKPYAKDTKDTYAIISIPGIIAKWKLSPIKLDTITDPTLHSILVEGSKAGTPVLTGAIMKRGGRILPALVQSQLTSGDFPFTVRTPTEDELQYYYALIPYELSDPILVVEGGGHAFICDFENDGKLFFIEML